MTKEDYQYTLEDYQRHYLPEEVRFPSAKKAETYYDNVFTGMLGERKSYLRWNWASAFFGSTWLIYRRMYGLAFVVIFLETIAYFFFPEPMKALWNFYGVDVPIAAIWFLVHVLFGFLGNLCYFYWIQRRLKTKKDPLNPSFDTTIVRYAIFIFVLSFFISAFDYAPHWPNGEKVDVNVWCLLSLLVYMACQTIKTTLSKRRQLKSSTFIIRVFKKLLSMTKEEYQFTLKDYQKHYLLFPEAVNKSPSIQKTETYYDRVFSGLLGEKKYYLQWNWASFLFGPLWLAYRRMYALAFLVIFLKMIADLFFQETKTSWDIYGVVVSIAVIGVLVRVLFGFLGNFYYFYWVQRRLRAKKSPIRPCFDDAFMYYVIITGSLCGIVKALSDVQNLGYDLRWLKELGVIYWDSLLLLAYIAYQGLKTTFSKRRQ